MLDWMWVFSGEDSCFVCLLHEFTESNCNELKSGNWGELGSFKAHSWGSQTQNELHESCSSGIYYGWVCGNDPWWCRLKVGRWV